MILEEKHKYNVGQLSHMFNVNEKKVIKYCQVLEKNGYLLSRDTDKNFKFTEKDITTLLCYFDF